MSEPSGRYRLVARHSGKCLTAAGTTTGVQLVQRTCDGSPAQSFRPTATP